MYSFKLIEYRQLLHHLGQLVPKGNYACCMWVGVACCLILCMLGNFACFLSSADILKKYFGNTIRASSVSNPDLD